MTLTSNTVYQHDEHGEVLVLDVHHVFEAYDLDSTDGQLRARLVRFSVEWDEYGTVTGQNPTSRRIRLETPQ